MEYVIEDKPSLNGLIQSFIEERKRRKREAAVKEAKPNNISSDRAPGSISVEEGRAADKPSSESSSFKHK